MTREEFIKVLDEKGYTYKIEGDKLVVTRRGGVWLRSLESLPPGVKFNNRGDAILNSLKTLPPGVEFNNRGEVELDSLTNIPAGVVFNNSGDVSLDSLIRGYLNKWPGLIEGISPNTLLNGMIKRGIFL